MRMKRANPSKFQLSNSPGGVPCHSGFPDPDTQGESTAHVPVNGHEISLTSELQSHHKDGDGAELKTRAWTPEESRESNLGDRSFDIPGSDSLCGSDPLSRSPDRSSVA